LTFLLLRAGEVAVVFKTVVLPQAVVVVLVDLELPLVLLAVAQVPRVVYL
jgi:hypothetical protein